MARKVNPWRDARNILRVCRNINRAKRQPSTMPSEGDFRAFGYSSIPGAIRGFHGGPYSFAIKHGLRPNRLPNHFLDTKENIRSLIDNWNTANGTKDVLPSPTRLNTSNPPRRDVVQAIYRMYDNFGEAASDLGYRYEPSKLPTGYWKEFGRVADAIAQYCNKTNTLGVMPSKPELDIARQSRLSSAISSHGGFPAVALRLGLRQRRRKNGSWTAKVIEDELRAIIEIHVPTNHLPTSLFLRAIGRADLDVALDRSPIKRRGWAKRLGVKMTRGTPDGYWRKVKNIYSTVRAFVQQHRLGNRMPSQEQMRNAGRFDLLNGIYRYGGGIERIAHELGLELAQRPKGHYDEFETVANELREFAILIGTPGIMPTREDLFRAGESGLYHAIEDLHGGYPSIAKRIGFETPDRILKNHSREEIRIAYELSAFFKIDINDHDVPKPNDKSRPFDVDIIIRELDLIVEWDSSYTHDDKARGRLGSFEQDKCKAEVLRSLGWQVIRVRESPLPQTSDFDVVVPRQKLKQAVNSLLIKIQSVCGVTVSGLDMYLARRSLAKVSEADAYYRRLRDTISPKRGRIRSLQLV